MKITFLGTGGAFSTENYHSNMLLEVNGRNLLIDCGSDARFSLATLGLDHTNVDAVYVSHLHADHAGGMEWLAFKNYFPHKRRIPLFINAAILENLWNQTMRGGCGRIVEDGGVKSTHLGTFFDTSEHDLGKRFMFAQQEFHMVQAEHPVPTYGLWWVHDGKPIYVSGDTAHPSTWHIGQSSVTFHDCETGGKSGIHAHYDDLRNLEPHVKKKMWLYHYGDGKLPDAEGDGFLGFVKRGETLEL
jgi:ribonuclease BN (tRNA processing enzyme)